VGKSEFTHTLGFDLASKPKTTGFCSIRWGGDGPLLSQLCVGETAEGIELHDKFISNGIKGLYGGFDDGPITKVGIDAPLGWPQPFVEAIASYHAGDQWPLPLDFSRAPFERRETDRFVKEQTGKTALSVSTDRIAYPAMRAAVILSDLASALGPDKVARDGSGLTCEVYPAAALLIWAPEQGGAGGEQGSYKKVGSIRVRLAQVLKDGVGLSDPNGLLAQCEESDDCLDALLSALVARAVETGATLTPPSDETHRLALSEGWIHLPCGPLDALR